MLGRELWLEPTARVLTRDRSADGPLSDRRWFLTQIRSYLQPSGLNWPKLASPTRSATSWSKPTSGHRCWSALDRSSAAWASHVTGADADNVPLGIGKGEGVFAPRKPVYQGRPSGSFDIVAVSARRGSLVLIAVAGERLTTRDMTPTLTKEPAD